MKTSDQKRRGRPLKGSDKVKAIRLDLRIQLVEKQSFQAAAELAGLDLSAWIRERLRNAARRELTDSGQQVPFMQPARGS